MKLSACKVGTADVPPAARMDMEAFSGSHPLMMAGHKPLFTTSLVRTIVPGPIQCAASLWMLVAISTARQMKAAPTATASYLR